jgi:uncharacterized lipoprotein YmbA
MDYSKLKAELHQLIDQVNDEAALYQIRSILEAQAAIGHDWADDLSENLREALEASLSESENGNGISHEEAIGLINARYGKR